MRDKYRGSRLGKGVSLLIIGCVLIAIGLSLGGHWSSPGFWPWGQGSHEFNFNWDFDRNGSRSWNDSGESIRDIPDLTGTIPSTVNNLDIELKASALVARAGSEGTYRANGFDAGSITVRVEGDTLVVRERNWEHVLNNPGDRKVEITLPEGVRLDKCRISMGAGSLSLEPLELDDLWIESGASGLRGSGLKADRARIQSGAGSIELTDCSFGETKLSAGAGRVRFTGSLGPRTEISAGAGEVNLSVGGSESDYRIEYSRGIGSVRINDESYTGVGDGRAGNRKADKEIRLTSGIGSISLDFTGDAE